MAAFWMSPDLYLKLSGIPISFNSIIYMRYTICIIAISYVIYTLII